MLKLKINGKENELSSEDFPQTLATLLDLLKIDQQTVVAEVNDDIIERKNFSDMKLNENDKVELIRFVGGG